MQDTDIHMKNRDINHFTNLLNALNDYEGQSSLFKSLNSVFITYLNQEFFALNESRSNTLYHEIMRTKKFQGHPFLRVLTKLLSGKSLTKKEALQTANYIAEYPTYPLNSFLMIAIDINQDQAKINNILKHIDQDNSLLLALAFFNKHYGDEKISPPVTKLTLNLYKYQIPKVALRLAHEAAKEEDFAAFTSLLKETAILSNQDENTLISANYTLFAAKDNYSSPFSAKLMEESIGLGNYETLLPLINYLEKSSPVNELKLMYYLMLGAHQNNAEIIKKLRAFDPENEEFNALLERKLQN